MIRSSGIQYRKWPFRQGERMLMKRKEFQVLASTGGDAGSGGPRVSSDVCKLPGFWQVTHSPHGAPAFSF